MKGRDYDRLDAMAYTFTGRLAAAQPNTRKYIRPEMLVKIHDEAPMPKSDKPSQSLAEALEKLRSLAPDVKCGPYTVDPWKESQPIRPVRQDRILPRSQIPIDMGGIHREVASELKKVGKSDRFYIDEMRDNMLHRSLMVRYTYEDVKCEIVIPYEHIRVRKDLIYAILDKIREYEGLWEE